MYEISYYKTVRGDCPFQSFLDGATIKVENKFAKLIEVLREEGPNLKRPYADVLRDGIRELRVGFGGDQFRALYFFILGRRVVITHGIIKKTEEVPVAEIERAIRYRRDYCQRLDRGDIAP
jgi:phage-related protein